MPESQIARIESKVDNLAEAFGAMRDDFGELRSDLRSVTEGSKRTEEYWRNVFAEYRQRIDNELERERQARKEADERHERRLDRAYTWGMGILATVISAGLIYVLFTTR